MTYRYTQIEYNRIRRAFEVVVNITFTILPQTVVHSVYLPSSLWLQSISILHRGLFLVPMSRVNVSLSLTCLHVSIGSIMFYNFELGETQASEAICLSLVAQICIDCSNMF